MRWISPRKVKWIGRMTGPEEGKGLQGSNLSRMS
jgi:hypothetical protein